MVNADKQASRFCAVPVSGKLRIGDSDSLTALDKGEAITSSENLTPVYFSLIQRNINTRCVSHVFLSSAIETSVLGTSSIPNLPGGKVFLAYIYLAIGELR